MCMFLWTDRTGQDRTGTDGTGRDGTGQDRTDITYMNGRDSRTDGRTDQHTDTQTLRHTDAQKHRHTDRQTDRQTGRQTDRQTDGKKGTSCKAIFSIDSPQVRDRQLSCARSVRPTSRKSRGTGRAGKQALTGTCTCPGNDSSSFRKGVELSSRKLLMLHQRTVPEKPTAA